MITNIDEILQVIREMPKPVLTSKGRDQGETKKGEKEEKQILTLIHKEDNLTDLLFQFVAAGYSPGVNFESGRITALKLELSKIFCIIQAQQLIKSAIDGVVVVDSEEVYNNMNLAMCTLNSKRGGVSLANVYLNHVLAGVLGQVAADRFGSVRV